jgi:hypothetical protein
MPDTPTSCANSSTAPLAAEQGRRQCGTDRQIGSPHRRRSSAEHARYPPQPHFAEQATALQHTFVADPAHRVLSVRGPQDDSSPSKDLSSQDPRARRRVPDCRHGGFGGSRLSLEMVGEVRQGGGESRGVILGGDAVRHLVGRDVHARPSIDGRARGIRRRRFPPGARARCRHRSTSRRATGRDPPCPRSPPAAGCARHRRSCRSHTGHGRRGPPMP